jgi:hypothetical protein
MKESHARETQWLVPSAASHAPLMGDADHEATKPWLPLPSTVGGKRGTQERTPVPAKDRLSGAAVAAGQSGLLRSSWGPPT